MRFNFYRKFLNSTSIFGSIFNVQIIMETEDNIK